MQTRILLPMAVCFSLTLAAGAAADERQDAARVEQLLAEIQKVVPPDWDVGFELVDPRHLTRGGSHPAIEIKSCGPLLIEHLNVLNLAPGQESPKSEMVVPIRLVAYPYMSPEDHAKARAENARLLQKRIDFKNEHLQKIERGYMGVGPIPPRFYDPKTRDEKRLIMQYSFLWTATEPRPLPTHYTDHLAIDMRYLPLDTIEILDDKQAKEYEQILGALEKIIVPYETER